MDLRAYRQTDREQLRRDDLLRLLSRTRGRILEVGSRDGYHSQILAGTFDQVVAIDLSPRKIIAERVVTTQASVTNLPFRENSFDAVLCAEVLEHVPDLSAAANEISRVARRDVLIGVPFKQDTRVSKTTCARCGKVNPLYGHINTFDESKLRGLFHQLEPVEFSFIGSIRERTTPFASWLMTQGGNPWGTYSQDEPCIFCGASLAKPELQTASQRVLASAAARLDRVQARFTSATPTWIHGLFRKR